MPDRIGNAAIAYVPSTVGALSASLPGDAMNERFHLLQAPLRELKYGADRAVMVGQSLDRTNRNVVAVSGWAMELAGSVRYDHDPQSLVDLLAAGARGAPMTYFPDLADPNVNYPVTLIAPLLPGTLDLDPQRGMLGDQQVQIRLRLGPLSSASPLSFDPLLHGTECLFWFQAGDGLFQNSVSESFARASSGQMAGGGLGSPNFGGYGWMNGAEANKARIQWMSTASSVGPRTIPALLLESSGKNYIPCAAATSGWTLSNVSSTSTPTGFPILGYSSEVFHVVDTSTAVFGTFSVTLTAFDASTFAVLSVLVHGGSTLVAAGLSTGLNTYKLINNSTTVANSTYLALGVTWSSGEPIAAIVNTPNTGVLLQAERWGNGWWRVAARTTQACSSSDSFQFQYLPGGTGVGSTASGFLMLPMVEV